MSTNTQASEPREYAGGAAVALGGLKSADIDPSRFAEAQITARSNEERAAVRSNSSLPVESWTEMDDSVYRAEDAVLNVASDIRGAGLTTDASIYDEELTWQPIDTSHSATVSMSPETAAEEGAPTYGKDGVPLPIVHSDYSIGFRERGPRGVGTEGSLDTLNAYGASYAVNATFEDMILYGWQPTIGDDGYTLYGLTNHPSTGTGTIGDWSTDPTLPRQNIRAMINQINNEQNHSPGNTGYWLYLASDLDNRLDDIVDQQSGDTVRSRVEPLSGLSRISTTDSLPAGSALMFRPTQDVIDIAVAEDLQTVQWDSPFRDHYKVMMSATPRIKKTLVEKNVGITYWTSA